MKELLSAEVKTQQRNMITAEKTGVEGVIIINNVNINGVLIITKEGPRTIAFGNEPLRINFPLRVLQGERQGDLSLVVKHEDTVTTERAAEALKRMADTPIMNTNATSELAHDIQTSAERYHKAYCQNVATSTTKLQNMLDEEGIQLSDIINLSVLINNASIEIPN